MKGMDELRIGPENVRMIFLGGVNKKRKSCNEEVMEDESSNDVHEAHHELKKSKSFVRLQSPGKIVRQWGS